MHPRIDGILEDLKISLGKDRTPGLQELVDNLRTMFGEYRKARSSTCREWRATFTTERTKADSYRTTRSINSQIKESQDKVLRAISTLSDSQTQSKDPIANTEAVKDIKMDMEYIRGEMTLQRKAIEELVICQRSLLAKPQDAVEPRRLQQKQKISQQQYHALQENACQQNVTVEPKKDRVDRHPALSDDNSNWATVTKKKMNKREV